MFNTTNHLAGHKNNFSVLLKRLEERICSSAKNGTDLNVKQICSYIILETLAEKQNPYCSEHP